MLGGIIMPNSDTEDGSKYAADGKTNPIVFKWFVLVIAASAIFCLGALLGFAISRGKTSADRATESLPAKDTERARHSDRTQPDSPDGTRDKSSVTPATHGNKISREEAAKNDESFRGFKAYREQSSQQSELTVTQRENLSKLMALGYLPGSHPAPKDTGVLIYRKELAYKGLNFLTSGHGPEALLLSMEGEVLHRWRKDLLSIWPDYEQKIRAQFSEFWRRAYLYENGNVLAIFENIGLIKVDKDSNLLWRYAGWCHHDMSVMDDGRIFVLEREHRLIPRIRKDKPVVEDFVTLLDSKGKLMKRISVLEAFEKSRYAPLLQKIPLQKKSDLFHTNALEILDGSLESHLPAFKEGNALISIHSLDTVAVLDMEKEVIIWALSSMWDRQHEPRILDNGNLLVFNNAAGEGISEAVECNPATQEIVWSFKGSADYAFFTKACGAAQRLPNGNTLISESDNGRAFEVTPGKAVVWEYISPWRAGENNELIATLFEMTRLPPDFPLDWLPEEKL